MPRMLITKVLGLFAFMAVMTVIVGVWAYGPRRVYSDVPVFETPDRYYGDLRLRRESPGSKVLLITRVGVHSLPPWAVMGSRVPRPSEAEVQAFYNQHGDVYRYDPESRQLTRVAPGAWEEATGEITEAGQFFPGPDYRTPIYDGVVKFRVGNESSRVIETHGQTALRTYASPTGELVPVLTADGWKRPSTRGMLFGSIGGGYAGQHYVELFTVPEGTPVGKPMRIPFTTARGIGMTCWSADGRYIVFATSDRTKLCVIPTYVEGG